MRLRETEATLNRVRDGIVSEIARQHLPDERLLYVDHSSDDFIAADGTVDRAKVEAECKEAAKKFNIAARGRPPALNPQQGSGTSGGAHVKPSWSQALRDGRNQ